MALLPLPSSIAGALITNLLSLSHQKRTADGIVSVPVRVVECPEWKPKSPRIEKSLVIVTAESACRRGHTLPPQSAIVTAPLPKQSALFM